ncbi:MAG: polysaccharide biosynthesis protein [Cryobacterium sp.]|nr:polysaccharide biosynthesis protein [Cryobacterium sp.]
MALKFRLFSPAVRAETRARGGSLVLRFGAQYLLDCTAWVTALVLAVYFRYEFVESRIAWVALLAVCAIALLLQLFLGWAFGLYRGRHTYGSFEEVRSLCCTIAAATFLIGLPVVVFGERFGIPRSALLIAAPLALVLAGGIRYVKRLYAEHQSKPGASAQLTLVYGAGDVGRRLVLQMITDRQSPYRPVGMIDDDPAKRKLEARGIPVLGSRGDLGAIAEQTGASVLIVAIARANAALLREIHDVADQHNIVVKVLPSLEEVLDGKSGLTDIHDVSIEELIGRHPVDTEVESIAGYLGGKRVLVTGAGGSIGAELCRQITRYGPSELIMLDRDESALQAVQISVSGHGLLDTPDVVLADIRDCEALSEIFSTRRPEVVFHAAALKHLPMLEQYPEEAWKTNIVGTLNVLSAAREAGVSTFVNISTDKAANPTSVLGHSKRVAEKLTAWAAEQTGHTYLSVRFGNVIGSRGSMLPTFRALIEAGGPLTVTHPDVTRFFMTIPEACQLVVQAGGIGKPGEVLILDMGEPVRILDVAQRMIAQSGKDVEIVFTGLREGEKLHEDLLGLNESDDRPIHPLIAHTKIAPTSPDRLTKAGWLQRLPRNGGGCIARDLDVAAASAARPT